MRNENRNLDTVRSNTVAQFAHKILILGAQEHPSRLEDHPPGSTADRPIDRISGQRSGVIAARNIGSCDHLHDATSGTDETIKRSPVGTSGASVEVGAARAASPRDRRDTVSVGHTGTGQTNTSLVGTSPTGAGRADTGCADTQKEAVIARKIRAQGLAAGRATA